MDNQYLRFGRENYNGYLRFGRDAHVLDEDTGNNPVRMFGNEDHFQITGRQNSDPFQRIRSLNIADDLPEFVPSVRIGRGNRDPFLRFGRAVPYLRFGKRNIPYLRFGRNSPLLTNQAGESFSTIEKNGAALQQPDDDVAILAGTSGLGEISYSADRKKRSVEPQAKETQVKGCVSDAGSDDSDTPTKHLELVDTRETRAGSPYMRFGKKDTQQNTDNIKDIWDKELELYIKNQVNKRKQEYMRFGRAQEGSAR